MLLSDVRHAMACSFFLDLTAQDTGLVFFLIHLELRRHPTNLAYISSRLLGWSIVLKHQNPSGGIPCSLSSVTFQFIWKFLRRWCDLLQRNSLSAARKATIADTTDLRVLTAIAAAVQMGLMKPVLRGKPSGVLVGREPSHLVVSR